MPKSPLQKTQWIKLGVFFIACVLGLIGVLFNLADLAIIAALCTGYVFWNIKENKSGGEGVIVQDRQEVTPTRLVLTITLFVFAVLLIAAVIYSSRKPETITISLILWLTAIALMMLAGIVFDRLNPFVWVKRIKNLSKEEKRKLFIEIAIVAVVTEIALFLRIPSLDHFPLTMHGDEGEIGMEALRVLGVGDPLPPFGIGWATLPSLFFYLPAGTIGIFGRNEIGLRMIGALFGSFSVLLVYLIGRKFWGKLAGFTAAWLIAVSHFNIHYSRLGVNCIEAAFFMVLFILLFLAPYSRNQSSTGQELGKSDTSYFPKAGFNITPYIAVGLTCGLAQYIGVYSRLVPLLAVLLYGIQFIQKRVNVIQIAVVGLTAGLVFAPLGVHYIQYPIDFTGRIDTVSIFNPQNIKNIYGQDATLSNSLFPLVKRQVGNNINFYLQSGDNSSFYDGNIPAFDFITALLFWLGLGVVFSRPRRIPETVLIFWLVLGTILGGILTNDAPSGTRLLTVTSVVFIIAGIFIQRMWDALSGFLDEKPTLRPLHVRSLSVMLTLILISILGINMYHYFGTYSKSMMNVLPNNIQKEIALTSPVDHVYLLGDGEIYVGHGAIRFLVGDGVATDLKNVDDLPALIEDGKGITVLATSSHFDELPAVQSRYPQGKLSYKYLPGFLIFMEYRIPPLVSQ